ncbi:unnamed protein product [Miscanthus lutarioriparius]|uniref:Uncharacterized protein n=1 Tax=Miscanthus lutarioriparius TaxID=422564 RepID=A0A811PCL3_9POAL|nr:unnamed protein product [Miscanthus lutarioriparius]
MRDLGNAGISGPLVPDLGGLKNLQYLCLDGFAGNPYLSDGCQDINECQSPELQISIQQWGIKVVLVYPAHTA